MSSVLDNSGIRDAALDRQHILRVEQPFTLADSEAEPDLAVGNRDDYRLVHPTRAELVVEVAITTEDIDREKTRIYAAAQIPECWLVMPRQKKIVVHRQVLNQQFVDVRECGSNDTLTFGSATLDCATLFSD